MCLRAAREESGGAELQHGSGGPLVPAGLGEETMGRSKKTGWWVRSSLLALTAAGAIGIDAATPARAVPAFAQQTGYACAQCHIGALGPQLTPFGRMFKMRGYSIRGGDQWYSHVPVAVWMQFGFEHYNKDLPAGSYAHYYNANDNAGLDAVSIFIAGGWQNDAGVGFGAFIQTTYDNTAKTIAEDNTDIKVTDQITLNGKDTIIGVSLNNGPGVADPYNDNGIWGYPYIGPFIGLGGNASLALDGGVLQSNTVGVTGYIWYDQSIYLEAGLYTSESPWQLQHTGEAYGLGSNTGVEPYVQFDKAWFWGPNNAHAGFTFWNGRFNPVNPAAKFGTIGNYGHNTYTDLWFQHGYQFLSDNDVHEVANDGYLGIEWQDLKGFTNPNSPLYGSSKNSNMLYHWHEGVNYFYQNTYGFNIAYDKVWGNKNQLLYNNGLNDGTGSIKGSPDTTFWLFEVDWVPFGKEDHFWPLRPFINWRLGLQYYLYTQFNGAGRNYDGFGRNASDNNTLFLYLWTVF